MKGQYKITGTQDFNDLVTDRIMSKPPEEVKKILENMFPSEYVGVIACGVDWIIQVGPVKVDIAY